MTPHIPVIDSLSEWTGRFSAATNPSLTRSKRDRGFGRADCQRRVYQYRASAAPWPRARS
jgi:hypothetical protein